MTFTADTQKKFPFVQKASNLATSQHNHGKLTDT